MINPFLFVFDPLSYRGFLFYSILVLGALSVLSLVTMVVHKIYVEFRESLCIRLRKIHFEQLSEVLKGRRKSLPIPATGISFDCLADAAIEMLTKADPDSVAMIRENIEKVGTLDHLMKVAQKSRSWVRRHLALERLGFLKYRHMDGFYRHLLVEVKDRYLMSKALWAHSFIATESDFPLIISTLKSFRLSSGKYEEYIFTNMIGSFRLMHGEERTAKILGCFILDENEDQALRRTLLESCGKVGFSGCADVAVVIFRRHPESPLMRITALRAAGEVGAGDIADILLPSLGHSDWRLRLVAAQYAHLCAGEAIPHLEELLGDASYHVRINAARVLGTCGEEGRRALERAQRNPDRFARDISRYVLAETR